MATTDVTMALSQTLSCIQRCRFMIRSIQLFGSLYTCSKKSILPQQLTPLATSKNAHTVPPFGLFGLPLKNKTYRVYAQTIDRFMNRMRLDLPLNPFSDNRPE